MKFRKKPIEIGAKQFTGDNWMEIMAWTHEGLFPESNSIVARDVQNGLQIRTLEGYHRANPGDWIIKGVKGEFYPCKPDIFEMTYEAAKDKP